MLKKSASRFCSFGLFSLSGLFGCMHKTNQIDQTNEIDQIDRRCQFRLLRDSELKFRSSL